MFFAAIAVTAVGSRLASPMVWLFALALLAVADVSQRERRPPPISPLAVAVALFVFWAVGNGFINPGYTAAGVFHPAFLLAGFLVSRRLPAEQRARVKAAALFAITLLAGAALVQSSFGGGRAHLHFETPNTLATVLNLALAPLLLRIAHGERRRALLAPALLLCAGLVATLSRGGFIALAGSLMLTFVLSRPRPAAAGLARLLAVCALGTIVGALALQLPAWSAPQPAAARLDAVATTLGGTLSSRLELYRLAWSAAGAHPWLGNGYLGFHALFEAGRGQVPSYAVENVTYFVHNDYLQTLVELGVPGLLALLAVVVLPFWLARRVNGRGSDALAGQAALAGLGTMAIHALGDFPFYVPLCLLLFGALLAEVEVSIEGSAGLAGAPRSRRAGFAAALVAALLLLPPALAEAASLYGERSWRSGHGESAAFGFELARRLQPRDWRYHWYAGQFWLAQAVYGGRTEAANRADHAFADGVRANSADPRPLLGRLATQLRFAPVLEDRQPAQTLRHWARRALALAPVNPAVRKDYAAALAQLGAAE